MKTKNLKSGILLIVCSFFMTSMQTKAQELKVDPKTFSMTIYGTTNVHNFDMKVTQVSGSLTMVNAKKVQSLDIEIPVK